MMTPAEMIPGNTVTRTRFVQWWQIIDATLERAVQNPAYIEEVNTYFTGDTSKESALHAAEMIIEDRKEAAGWPKR